LVLFLVISLAAVAQSGTQIKIQLDIPFNFMVAGKSLPAGHYMVAPLISSDKTAWRIFNDQATATVLTQPEESTGRAHNPSMVFLPTSSGYALVQFWPAAHLGRTLTAPKVEHALLAETNKYVEISSK
jgi:hypothetical protein